ncbi:MAG: Sapep family Mn(2+)-dependent dipeptidase [Clostridiales Family XIII bacterium]|nr:Sapep family Mn(2+)-dependent dipeptidase [Clostridiales Family XIII bacterium]
MHTENNNASDLNARLAARIDALFEEAVRQLRALIAIRSVAAPADGDSPFGAGVQAAFDHMLALARADGFATLNADNYGGHIEFGGADAGVNAGPAEAGELSHGAFRPFVQDANADESAEKTLGILVHLDVVPEGNGWSCDPFLGKRADGRIYGRGATDDKGPAIACYYAMKALKDCGFAPAKRVRLILGLDEETGWEGMRRYLARASAPDFGFTPDADFPAIHGEKGILIFGLAKKLCKTAAKGLHLRKLSGGSAANMVADTARAVVRGDSYEALREKVTAYRSETGRSIYAKGVGKSLEISASGISAHGATPEKGLNAISVLMDFLPRVGLVNESALEFVDFYNRHIGFDLHGAGLGCDLADEPSGPLVFNVGTVSGDAEAVLLTVNVRYPVTATPDMVYDAMLPVIHKYDLGLVKLDHKPPVYVPADDPLIETLADVYRRHTGDAESRPFVIGGGTYARAAKNIVAFGPGFPGEPELAHQKDECISEENLRRLTKIYADAIRALSERDFVFVS